MVNTTTEYRRALYTNPRFYGRATIELNNGHVLNLQDREDESAFLPDGIKVDDSVSTSGTFDIGAAIVNRLVMRLDNTTDAFSEYDFTDAVITAYVGLQLEGRIEWVKKGVFNAEDPKAIASILSIEAMDNMVKFDKAYDGDLTFPTTLQTAVLYCCNRCNVTLVNSAFDNWDYVIRENPFVEDNGVKTYRQILMYCAQIAGCFARCNCDGMLELKWYDTSVFESMKTLDGGVFDSSTPYNTGDSFDGGNFSNYNSGGSFDGGTFLEQRKYHHLFALSSLEVSTDDVVITAIRVTAASGEDDEENSVDGETAQYGQDGYVLHVKDNPFIEHGRAAEVVEHLGRKIVGMRFRKMNASGLGDPAIEAGDCAIVTDRKGNSYQCYLTGITYTTGSYETFVTSAESPARNSSQRGSESTDVIVTARNEAEKVVSNYDKVVQQMTQLISAGFGMYFTPVEQDDGSTIFYMHDKSTIEESSYTCYMTSNGILASLDGGTTWAVDKYGNALYNVLTARGINADWINTGRLVIRDQDGNVTLLADCNTGEIQMVVSMFSLKGKTIEQISQDANEQLINDVAADLQAQIGQPEAHLSQEKILDLLTNKGVDKAIYMIGNQLYISFTYARGGTLALGGANNGNGVLKVYDGDNVEIVKMDNRKVSYVFGTSPGKLGYQFDTLGLSAYWGAEIGTENIRQGTQVAHLGLAFLNLDTQNAFRTRDGGLYLYSGGALAALMDMGTTGAGRLLLRSKGVEMMELSANAYSGFPACVIGDRAGEIINVAYIMHVFGGVKINGSVSVTDSLVVNGIKSRVADTQDYGKVSQYCYEMASPFFGDIGAGRTGEDGTCHVSLDDIFGETVNTGMQYQVFLQKEGPGDLWVKEKKPAYFIVEGTANLPFAWEIKASQRGFENERLENYDMEAEAYKDIDYAAEAAGDVEGYYREMEDMYNEEADQLYETDNG